MGNENGLIVGLIILVALVLSVVAISLIDYINTFSRELRYINNEIGHTIGSANRYWRNRRRRLWLSLLPFVKYENNDPEP